MGASVDRDACLVDSRAGAVPHYVMMVGLSGVCSLMQRRQCKVGREKMRMRKEEERTMAQNNEKVRKGEK